VNDRRHIVLPALLVVALALTRLQVGTLPPGFSAIYALAFCGAVYFRGALAWWMPFGTLLVSDLVLNVFYYDEPALGGFTIVTYGTFALLILFGRRFKPSDPWWKLLGGSLAGAVLFYLVTNTFAWMSNPAYAKTLAGWLQALTTGLPGFPPTWTFFRNTLLSSGLFTGLFVAAMKLSAVKEPEEEEADDEEPATPEVEPEQAKS
jgi:hypothetical protein